MQIISLNIQHGGASRTARILDWLASQSPDFVVLPEWRCGARGELIKNNLLKQGFSVATAAPPGLRSNGVLVASKAAFESRSLTPTSAESGALLLANNANWRLLGAYFPQLNAKRAFFDVCFEQAAYSESVPFLLLGDLNTGRNGIDVEGNGAPFACADMFEALGVKMGLVDLWRLEHGQKREWSWRSPINGFRVDHALANRQFLKLFTEVHCAYDHFPRENGLTDHSALILNFCGK